MQTLGCWGGLGSKDLKRDDRGRTVPSEPEPPRSRRGGCGASWERMRRAEGDQPRPRVLEGPGGDFGFYAP